jgi:YqjK-like protein
MRLRKVETRRAELIQRIAHQRSDLAILTHSLEQPLSFIDKGYALVQKVKQQPKLVFLGTLLFAAAIRKPVIRKSAVLLSMAEWFLFNKNR